MATSLFFSLQAKVKPDLLMYSMQYLHLTQDSESIKGADSDALLN